MVKIGDKYKSLTTLDYDEEFVVIDTSLHGEIKLRSQVTGKAAWTHDVLLEKNFEYIPPAPPEPKVKVGWYFDRERRVVEVLAIRKLRHPFSSSIVYVAYGRVERRYGDLFPRSGSWFTAQWDGLSGGPSVSKASLDLQTYKETEDELIQGSTKFSCARNDLQDTCCIQRDKDTESHPL